MNSIHNNHPKASRAQWAKLLLSLALLGGMQSPSTYAQRVTDQLDRGLIVVPSGNGYQVSWRLLGEEYYDVTYNLYRDGSLIAEGLKTSNYHDASGTAASQYTVSAVVRGVEQAQCAAVQPWSNSYLLITPEHKDIKSTLTPNDACCADLDGDGQLEILMKFDNASEISQSYPRLGPVVNGVSTEEYTIFEMLKLNGERMWWVNCGPNMGDFQNNEQNLAGYDWDCDGKAEVVMLLKEGSTIHMSDGSTYVIGQDGKNGTAWTNYRAATGGGVNWFLPVGKEFLVYCDGTTGQIYDIIDYPLARLESGENDINSAWGDGSGHRCSKFFFGAPYLDGHKPSIFLARGIYTRHKMKAFDVDPTTHKLTERWRWYNNTNGPWKGQGYHNYGIADVDMDGRDEIVFGSMVIDDNGLGLSTTGLGHGDAQHCGDFNPYTKGLELYTCQEDNPGNVYRDATTAKIYHRYIAGSDDGRAMMDNFCNDFPGSIGCSAREGAISSVTYEAVDGMSATGINTNFRIYWDGDLCSETFNSQSGKNTAGCVAKYGSWSPIYTCEGSMTNNDTKSTPCFQGDILGDWREEIIMRDANNNIRIYSTPTATSWRVPTLWSDHQYRNAMVWQMNGYNQPPHVSYFLGEMEGITMAPPPLTTMGREVVASGATVGTEYDGKHVLLSDNADTQLALAEGAKPYVLTINVPSWVQGTALSECSVQKTTINYTYYTCTVSAGSLASDARLVKQGDGALQLPNTEFTHTGETRVWGGTLIFDGSMTQSDLWLNRHTTLQSNGGKFKSVTALYGSQVSPGGLSLVGTMTVDSLYLDFGSRLVINLQEGKCDSLKLRSLRTVRKTGSAWTQAGPEYLMPVLEVVGTDLQAGDYVIAECDALYGSLSNIKVEGVEDFKTGLRYEDGRIILTLGGTRGASVITWTGRESAIWDYATTANFKLAETGAGDIFVNGDQVEFSDVADRFTVQVTGDLKVDTLRFANETKGYTLQGDGHIVAGALVKEGAGTLTITNDNSYTGGNYLRGGTVVIQSLANDIQTTGSLGGKTTSSAQFTIQNGAQLKTTSAVTCGSPIKLIGSEGGVLNNSADFTMQSALYGTLLTKTGGGTLIGNATGTLQRLVVQQGTLRSNAANVAQVIEMQGGSLYDAARVTYSNEIYIAEGKQASWTTCNRSTYTNKLTGTGSVTVYCATEKGTGWYATRTPLKFNLSAFEGTLVAGAVYTADARFTLSTDNGGTGYTLNIPAGIIVQNEGKTLAMGQLTGSGDLGGYCTFSNNGSSGTNTWQVGNDEDFSFSGRVIGADAFVKQGTGTMSATGVWTTTGKVTVSGGTLKVSSKTCLGTGALEVTAGATLQATSYSPTQALTNSSVTIRGRLYPNMSNIAYGSVLFNGQNVTIANTGELHLTLGKASTSTTMMSGCAVKGVGTLALNGKLHLSFYKYVPAVGDELRLWTNVTKVTGTPTIQIDEVDGMIITVDDSRLLSEGVLVVTGVTSGIDALAADAGQETLFNLRGQKAGQAAQPSGIYVQKGKKIIVR